MATEWEVRGAGRTAHIVATCEKCHGQIIIAEPRLNCGFKHCGSFERCPEKVYEECMNRRDAEKRRVPERPEDLKRYKVQWI